MFGRSRKNRPPPPPLTRESADPNAATAAASAFMRREPSVSLSSAAAAAALKARPTTPTNVAEVQSKRTMRRSPSVSSTASRDRNRASRDMRRSPSVASMTDRTFRSPSPGAAAAPRQQHVPPVPSLPRGHDAAPTRSPSSSHKPDAPLLQTQNFRTASQKQRDGQQSSWFGAAATGHVAPRGASSSQTPDGRPGSPSPSINFSYPRARMESPAPSTASEQALVYDANSRRMVPKADMLFRSQSLRESAEKPTRKRRTEVSRSGSHLARGTVGRTQVASEAPQTSDTKTNRYSSPPARLPSPEPSPEASRREPSPVVEPEPQREPPVIEHPTRAVVPEPKPQPHTTATQPPEHNADTAHSVSAVDHADGAAPAPAPSLGSQPPAVQEEQPLEIETNKEATQPSRHDAPTEHLPAHPSHPGALDGAEKHLRSVGQVPLDARKPSAAATVEENHLDVPSKAESTRRERVHSESPARSARFAPASDQLLVRHEPPPRSLSPRKSAMKRSSSIREASPSDDGSDVSAVVPTPGPKDDQAKKKSVHVSFNDEKTVVVGEAAAAAPVEPTSPSVASTPPVKKPWQGLLGRRDKYADSSDDPETVAMTPRPALPLFGSVRDKKHREPDSERPLVRPSERAWSPPPASSSPPPRGVSGGSEATGTSTDSVIGSILAHDSSAKNEANISRTREPLPPVVTSIEGTGYDSSSMASSDLELDHSDLADPSSAADSTVDASLDTREADVGSATDRAAVAETAPAVSGGTYAAVVEQQRPSGEIPTISIATPTPPAQEENQVSPDNEYFDVPGGFPDDEEPSARPEGPSTPQKVSPISTSSPSAEAAQKHSPPPSPTRPESIAASISTSPPMTDIQEEDENSSIYSDAYEDMSEAEEGGFMSLDAVLTAPADSGVSKVHEKAKDAPREHDTASVAVSEGKLQDPPQIHDDWDNAKTYWRSLTLEKRRQLEREALEDAGDQADQEGDAKKKRGPKKSKNPLPAAGISTDVKADRAYQAQPPTATPGSASKFRKSMRGPPISMVTEDGSPTPQASGSMRKTLRTNGADSDTQSPARAPRPSSYHPGVSPGMGGTPKKTQSIENRPSSAGGMSSADASPTLRRRGSDSSESSFRRARPLSQGFGFRSTMRASPQETDVGATKGSGRFSLRSLSPSAAAFRRSSFSTPPPDPAMFAGTRMRQSMRSPPPQQQQGSKMKMPSFGRAPGKKAAGKRGGSRFADSSDEEDGDASRRAPFHSRFADSSDEDEAARPASKGGFATGSMRSSHGANSAAAAALGLPAPRQRTGSPDRSDSDMIYQPKRQTSGASGRTGSGTLQRSRSGRGSLAPTTGPGKLETEGVGERPQTHRRRGSFMSTILRRKRDDKGKISREVGESGARRDTRLERSTDHLNVIRNNSGGSRRLHKREPSWPLPEEEDDYDDADGDGAARNYQTTASDDARPSTATEPRTAAAQKSSFLKRRSASYQAGAASGGAPPTGAAAVPASDAGAGVPKKKFGTLRKMFGLDD